MLVTPFIFGEGASVFWKAPYFTLCLEVAVCTLVVWLVVYVKNTRNKHLSSEEKAAIIAKFCPEPLVPDVPADHHALKEKIISGKVGKRIVIDGIDCLNLGSHNYLSLLGDEEIQKQSLTSLRKYGVGSCGPRGFYGTVDVHLELEERLAKYMDCEEAVVYSYAFSTIASAIPAYAKRGDVIFVDEAVHFAIQKGMDASRSKIYYFKHNDMKDLEDLLRQQEEIEKRNPKKLVKKFLIAEGIYMNTGEICPLPQLVELRKRYKLRMILDETVSFGTLGKNGRGVTEHFNIDKTEVDLISSSLEHAIGSIGGFCVGTTFVIEHQRLSGLGYCFSASLPPLLTQAAICALDKFENSPEMFAELQNTSVKVHEKMLNLSSLTLRGHELSPIKHLYLNSQQDYDTEFKILSKIVDKCIENKLGITLTAYLEEKEKKCPRPSIRLAVCRTFNDDDINFAFETLNKISKQILN